MNVTIEEVKREAEAMGFTLVQRLPYYTINTLSERTGTSRRTVEKWVSRLPHVKMGKTIKFDYNEIERRIASGKLLND